MNKPDKEDGIMQRKKLWAAVAAMMLLVSMCACAGTVTGESLFGLREPTQVWYGQAGLSSGSNNPTVIDPIVEKLNALTLEKTEEAGSAAVKMYDLTFEQDGKTVYLVVTDGKVKFDGQWYRADTDELIAYLAENYI
jgi:ABC-type oligopeptide transport system substrate-binding subunit